MNVRVNTKSTKNWTVIFEIIVSNVTYNFKTMIQTLKYGYYNSKKYVTRKFGSLLTVSGYNTNRKFKNTAETNVYITYLYKSYINFWWCYQRVLFGMLRHDWLANEHTHFFSTLPNNIRSPVAVQLITVLTKKHASYLSSAFVHGDLPFIASCLEHIFLYQLVFFSSHSSCNSVSWFLKINEFWAEQSYTYKRSPEL